VVGKAPACRSTRQPNVNHGAKTGPKGNDWAFFMANFNFPQQFGFVPMPLLISDRPELNIFPFNIFFLSHTVKDGEVYSAKAIYIPNLYTYRTDTENGKKLMTYTNQYGGDAYIVIEYDPGKGIYHAMKHVGGVFVLDTVGPDWKWFFVNLTINGLHKGEACMYEKVSDRK
jgi:hypothetical protein